jgi:hypothetical protein
MYVHELDCERNVEQFPPSRDNRGLRKSHEYAALIFISRFEIINGPDAGVCCLVYHLRHDLNSNFNFTFQQGQGSLGTSIICPHNQSMSIIHYSKS